MFVIVYRKRVHTSGIDQLICVVVIAFFYGMEEGVPTGYDSGWRGAVESIRVDDVFFSLFTS